MKKLFAQEVPEIYDGIIEIKAAARDPGSRAKIGVHQPRFEHRPGRGLRRHEGQPRQAVVQEMQGEKIDIIPWSADIATFVVNALQPASVSRVVIDEEEERIEVVGPRRPAQPCDRPPRPERSARLAADRQGDRHSHRTGRQRQAPEGIVDRSTMFETELDVDETMAQLLVAKASRRLRKSPTSSPRNLEPSKASTKTSPPNCRAARRSARTPRRRQQGRADRTGSRDDLAAMPHLTEAMLVTLGKAGSRPSTISPISPTDELVEKKRIEPRRRSEDAPKRPEHKGGICRPMGSATNRATRSSWPPARTG